MNPQQIIQEQLHGYLVAGKSYPRPLPPELQDWYCYTSDGGHCLMVAIKSLYTPGSDSQNFLVPAPVKSVLRAGYTQDNGYLVVDLPYNSQVGLITPGEDDEF